MVSLNLHRRHLDESQRAMVAASIANLEDGQRKSGAPIGAGAVTQEQAANLLNISRRNVQRATKVQESGVPELSEKVMSGEVAVSTASFHFLTSHRSGAIFGNNRRALLTGTFIHTLKTGEALCRTAYTK